MDLTDLEITALYELLNEEFSRNYHEPSRVDEDVAKALNELHDKVAKLAKARGFWWAR